MKGFLTLGVGLICFGGFALSTGASDPARTWSCSTAAKFSCAQWDQSMDADTLAEQQAGCTQLGGRVAHAPCPANDAVGTCVAHAGYRTQLVYYAGRDVRLARSACAILGGTWR
jgi:hypothetical protein